MDTSASVATFLTSSLNLSWLNKARKAGLLWSAVRGRAPGPFYEMLGQTHVHGWSRVIASHNGGSTSYIFPLRLGVLQWSRQLFNYWKNKKTIIEKFLILLTWNWIYIDHRKITWLWSQIQSKIKYMDLFPSYNLKIKNYMDKHLIY